MHSRYFNSKGNEVPSVTTVLNVLNKEGLLEWSNNLGKRGIDYKSFLESKANLGSLVHECIEAELKQVAPAIITNTATLNKVKEYVNTFKTVKEGLKISNAETEVSLSCEEFGGTLDLICDIALLNRTVTVLADFKTSKQPYITQFIQLAGYLELLKRNNHPKYDKIEWCMIISITDKKYKIQYISKENTERFFTNVFLNLLHVYNSWTIAKNEFYRMAYAIG